MVRVPRVAESPVSFECRVTQTLQLHGCDGVLVPTWLTLGEVVAVHIARDLLRDGVYAPANLEDLRTRFAGFLNLLQTL